MSLAGVLAGVSNRGSVGVGTESDDVISCCFPSSLYIGASLKAQAAARVGRPGILEGWATGHFGRRLGDPPRRKRWTTPPAAIAKEIYSTRDI